MFYASIKKKDKFIKILRHLEKYSFVKSSENGKINPFNFGPMGKKIFENIRAEWMRSNLIHRDQQVFMCETANSMSQALNIKDSYLAARKLHSELPFGLVDIKKCRPIVPQSTDDSYNIKPYHHTVYRYIGLFTPDEARQFYYRWQLERKRWWRLFSRDPGNFSVTAETVDDCETATVTCQYNWAQFYLETIQFHSSSWFDQLSKEQNDFSIVVERKRVMPHVIECCVSAELATLLFMCDSFTTNNNKPTLVFHRKLSPYKFAFSFPTNCEEHENDILDLCRMLCLELRRRGIDTLWPSITKKPQDHQLDHYDSLGIPYTVAVTLESLTNGIIGIRDRDTTLQEEVHVTDIGDYGELLIKNYEIKNF